MKENNNINRIFYLRNLPLIKVLGSWDFSRYIFLEIISRNWVCFFHEITAKIIGPRLASFFSSYFPFTFINWLKIEESFMKVFGELLLQLWWGWKSFLSNIHTTRIHAQTWITNLVFTNQFFLCVSHTSLVSTSSTPNVR